MASFNLDANWTHWVRENLVRGSDEATIAGVLRDNFSISLIKAQAIIQKVRQTPLPKSGGQTVVNNDGFERREWMLKTLDKLQKLSSDFGHIPSVTPPQFSQFIAEFYSQNKPVLLENAIEDWPAKNWTPQTLLDVATGKDVEVQYDRNANPTFEMDSIKHKKAMPFDEYFDLVMSAETSNNFYMTANNAKANQEVFGSLFSDVKNIADGYFDEASHKTRSFIWFGPKGNYTPLHHDQTNNMFVQVYGRKKFWLVSPLQTPYLYNERAVFSPIDLRNINETNHPLASNVTAIEVVLNPGDTLFIPIGLWHQVESLDVSISLTMTNFNAPNSFT